MAETRDVLLSADDVFTLRGEIVDILIDHLSIDDDLSVQIKGHDQAAEAIIKFFAGRLSPVTQEGTDDR